MQAVAEFLASNLKKLKFLEKSRISKVFKRDRNSTFAEMQDNIETESILCLYNV